ncbi:hypothetical protein [Anaeromyxobacter dehalogenans]|uniref:Mucin-associated surface protein (MASP), putative n=1 Tax=Anaeromyxobacter dehalogenans (strain 2CP-C) TaxID=290397 RepID=Q2IKC2_ANADE|nr:hypothetical protein [Anaeromyxobacter dehalogenans]ABC82102.1 mucin-associated surface protein (MASP), putative [Anaeromyxobacter dehalogenans 2CP-C]
MSQKTEKQHVPNVNEAEAAAQRASTEARAAAERVAALRAALAHAETHPLDFSDGETYASEVARLRYDLAKAADTANRAQAAREAAAEALQAAKDEQALSDAPRLEQEAEAARAQFVKIAQECAASLAATLACAVLAHEALHANRAELRAAGHVPEGDARTSMGFAWLGLLDKRPGAVGALATATNVLAWVEAAPVREAEEKEFQRRRALERERAALAGHLGPEAKAEAEARRAADIKRMSDTRGGGAFLGVRGSVAEKELAVYRANASLNGKGE